jgi:hypothetical protein
VRRLTDEERIALKPFGPEGEGPIFDETFAELEKLGYGKWVEGARIGDERVDVWEVTPLGQRALELDTLARENIS